MPGGPNSDSATAMFFMGFWFLMALVLFFLRPKARAPADKSRDQPVNIYKLDVSSMHNLVNLITLE